MTNILSYPLDSFVDIGLNVLNKMLNLGLNKNKCDEINCVTFGTSLNFVLTFFNIYPSLKKIHIYSNDEKVILGSEKNRQRIQELYDSGCIQVFHNSIDESMIHAKIYRFCKNGEVQFIAIGSPNLSKHSNMSYETLLYVFDKDQCNKIWEDFLNIGFKKSEITSENPGLNLSNSLPSCLIHVQNKITIDEEYLDGLWAHQRELLSWSVNKPLAIINIPPGTGKTKISERFIKYHTSTGDYTTIIVVPTLILLKQWTKLLIKEGFPVFEWGASMNDLGKYWYNPNGKILITIYSRFTTNYKTYFDRFEILSPNVLIILDECHNIYEKLNMFSDFKNLLESSAKDVRILCLSATLDSFKTNLVTNFKTIMGGDANLRNISLPTFYSYWNNHKNNTTPILKKIEYTPIKYNLNIQEMEELKKYTRNIIIEQTQKTIQNSDGFAAIKRANWLRGLEGGILALEEYLNLHLDVISKKSAIFFVQTNSIAERIRDYVTSLQCWDKENSVYIYDSYQDEEYRNIAMEQFRKNIGFFLISEKMLSEGFDLPKVDLVVLHGSQKSSRDWLQKIGRAIRFNPDEPDSVAQIVDIVFCDTLGNPINMERDRFEILSSVSK